MPRTRRLHTKSRWPSMGLGDMPVRWLISTGFLMMMGAPWAEAAGPAPTIVTLGDSYINGHGISDPADRFSAKVGAGLSAAGRNVVFQDVGFKNTSSDALLWLQSPAGRALLAKPVNHALILETAQNDCTLFNLEKSRNNLDKILETLASKNIPVLLVGTVAYDFCVARWGPAYRADFTAMFSEFSTKYGDLLYPDFKTGIEGRADLLQYDQDHPNAAGEAVIAASILPAVEALIERVH